MNLKIPDLNTNAYVVIGTILILALVYFFYLTYYIGAQENKIISTRFRVLDQIGNNVDKKLNSYIKNANNQRDRFKTILDSLNIIELEKNQVVRQTEIVMRKEDFNKALSVVDLIPALEIKDGVNNSSKYVYPIPVELEKITIKIDTLLEDIDTLLAVILETSYDDLIAGLTRNDVFDGLILIRDSSIIYNSHGQDMVLASYSTFEKVIKSIPEKESEDKFQKTTTAKSPVESNIIFSGKAFDIIISNEPHKAFLKPIKVQGDTWYVVGLMESRNFNSASRSIAPWIIIMLSLFLILLILGLPVIKLKVMSKTEELETSTIINFAISILLGGSLMVLFLFFQAQNIASNNEIDGNLVNLSTGIYDTWEEEMDKAYGQLETFSSYYDNGKVNLRGINNPFKNKVRKNILSDSTSYLSPNYYPFADYYFWVDSLGRQAAYFTPFNEYGTLSNLSSRDYVNKKDEWFFPDEHQRKFRIESIVSITSGNVKGAISMPRDSKSIPVMALSSRFYSLIDPIIPKNYSFCIIDKQGKVWFHSNENLNLTENFIEESERNKNLSAAIYRRNSIAFNLNYYNNPHRVYLRPMNTAPLYLVTLYNKNADKSFKAQIITLTLIFMVNLFIIIFIQIAVLMIIERRFQWRLTKNILMKITRPKTHLDEIYLQLTYTSIIVFIVLIPFLLSLDNVHAFISLIAQSIILFSYMNWKLNDNLIKKEARNWFLRFNIFLLIIVNTIGGILNNFVDFHFLILFQVFIIAVLYLCNTYFSYKPVSHSGNYVNNFINLLLCVLVLFGIVPSVKFYELAYNTEIEIQAKHIQVDLMNQKENRNLYFRTYYNRITQGKEIVTVDKIHEERKKLGDYSSILNNTKLLDSTEIVYNYKNLSTGPNNKWQSLISSLRPFYDKNVIENKFLKIDQEGNSGQGWRRMEPNLLVFNYASFTEDLNQEEIIQKTIVSNVDRLRFLMPFRFKHFHWSQSIIYSLILWMGIVIFLYLFYILIKFGIRKIYCLDVIENYAHQTFIERVRNHLIARNDMIITRLSSIDETEGFRKELVENFKCLYVNWSENAQFNKTIVLTEERIKSNENTTKKTENDEILAQSVVVVINNFDRNYNNQELFTAKVDKIRKLIDMEDILLIVLSQTNAQTILNHYSNLVKNENGKEIKEKDSIIKLIIEFREVLKKIVLLGQSINYKRSYEDEMAFCNSSPKKLTTKDLIHEELTASDYLRQLEPSMMDYYHNHFENKNHKNPEELIIRRIDLLAEKYYLDLLNSCNIEEKYVLYDTADDLITNPKNKSSIVSLLEKGILIKKCDKINFMNISFRRFVLNNLSKAETSEIAVKMGKETGSWKSIRLTLAITIVALFSFIAIANQNFFENLNELFVAFGGGVTVITSILGILSRKNKITGE